MSVIPESQAEDELIIIGEFHASPKGEAFSWKTSHKFRIGDRVRYVGSYRDEHFKDHPVGWMVVFDAEDGKRYVATQTYFVTEDCWERLKRFFAKRVPRKRKPRKAPSH